jgi:hypothetical protein
LLDIDGCNVMLLALNVTTGLAAVSKLRLVSIVAPRLVTALAQLLEFAVGFATYPLVAAEAVPMTLTDVAIISSLNKVRDLMAASCIYQCEARLPMIQMRWGSRKEHPGVTYATLRTTAVL